MRDDLTIEDLKYCPENEMELHERSVVILGADLAERLQAVGKGQVLAIETILTEAKLDTIVELAKPGTLVFSQFVESIFPMIRDRLTREGFRVGTFNGEDKSGLELFKRREVDVLIGSSALGTGVDGLQYVCNRLIVSCLPWTSAGYEQLLGRVYRQGSTFHDVEVFSPQVVLRKWGRRVVVGPTAPRPYPIQEDARRCCSRWHRARGKTCIPGINARGG